MRIDVLTLFPEMIEQALRYSVLGRAQRSEILKVRAHQLRQWAIDKHGTVDDTPYGGGPGMIMRVDVARPALEAVDPRHQAYRLMLTPDGQLFNQQLAVKLAARPHLVLLSGRYEGFDARIDSYLDLKLSIGPYVLNGGELPALVVIEALARLLPGVLGNPQSLIDETFANGEYPQYTRPETYDGQTVPAVLLSGHHAEIAKWRQQQRKISFHDTGN